MNRPATYLALAVVAALALTLVACGSKEAPSQPEVTHKGSASAGASQDGTFAASRPEKPEVGKMVPDFTMAEVDGTEHTPESLMGKVVLIDFWASWCGPCKEASKTMQALHREFAEKGLFVIGANASEEYAAEQPLADDAARLELSKQAITEYQAEHKYDYTFTVFNDRLFERWGFQGLPAFVVIGRDGKVVYMTGEGWGAGIERDMRAAIERALG